MAVKLLLTTAGLDEMIAADQSGTDRVVISECALGSGKYTPSQAATALRSEFKRLTTVSGGAVGGNIVHVEVTDASNTSYSVYEVGLFSSSGTLIAIASQTTPILTKAKGATALLAFDIALEDISVDTLQFGATNYLNPPATETTQGVAEIATQAEVNAGEDDTRIVTPKKLAAWIASKLSPYLKRNALLDLTYPVGSVYLSTASTSPATLFGGTWERIQGRFLLAASSAYAAGSTGGEASHTLTANEMPSHNHGGATGSAGSHTPSGTISGGSHTHTGTVASNGRHAHGRGTMDITGGMNNLIVNRTDASTWGAVSKSDLYLTDIDRTGNRGVYAAALNVKASDAWSGVTSYEGAHAHDVTIAAKAPSMAFSGTAVPGHTHTLSSQGGGAAHNNLPPYLAVYAWKRTA